MITATVAGVPLTRKLERARDTFNARMARLIREMTVSLESSVKLNLDNRVLHRRTGKLSRSVHSDTDQTGLVGRVYAGKEAPYGRLHEFGATVPAHTVEGHVRTKLFGRKVAPYYVPAYNVKSYRLPERSFLRSAARLYRGPLQQRTRALVEQVMTGK